MYIFSHRVVSCLPNSRVGLPGWMVAWSRRRRIFWGHQNLELVHKVNTNFPDIVGDILKTGGSTVVPVWVGKDDLPRPLGAKFGRIFPQQIQPRPYFSTNPTFENPLKNPTSYLVVEASF